jgi:outer membrane protein assembly factor BamB
MALAPVEPLIDLGELSGRVPVDALDRNPSGRPPRGLLIALALLLAAGLLVADRAPVRLRTVVTTPSAPATFHLVDDVLYVFDEAYAPNHVSAYRLTDGHLLWNTVSPGGVAYDQVSRVGDVTFLIPNPCTAASPVQTVALDTRTGRELWRREGIPEERVAGDRLVVMGRPGPTYGCGGLFADTVGPPAYWDAVDVATGRVVWSLRVPQAARVSYDYAEVDGLRQTVLIAGDGTVRTHDLRTGIATGTLRLPELALPPTPATVTDAVQPIQPYLEVAGELALMVGRQPDTSLVGVVAYDLRTLTPRWTHTVASMGPDLREGRDYYGAGRCGDRVCLFGSATTVVLDPPDGRELWRTPLKMIAAAGDRVLTADPDIPESHDKPGGLTLHDLRTGRQLADLAGWQVLVSGGYGAPVLLGFTARNRTWLATADLGSGLVTPTGSAAGWYGSCEAGRPFIACRRLDGSVRAWRVTG